MFRLNQLSNSFIISTLKCHLTTTVSSGIYYSILECGLSTQRSLAHWSGSAFTASGEYKLTPTQCLLNVGPASTVLASIHSAIVSTSCWRECVPMPFKCWPMLYTMARQRTNARNVHRHIAGSMVGLCSIDTMI